MQNTEPSDDFTAQPCVCEADLSDDEVVPGACHEDCLARYLSHKRQAARQVAISINYEAARLALVFARRYKSQNRERDVSGVVGRVRELRNVIRELRGKTQRERASVRIGEQEAAHVAAEAWGL